MFAKQTSIRERSARFGLGILLLLLLLLSAGPVTAAGVNGRAELPDHALQLWLKINEARHNPRQALLRLGIDEAVARAALGEDGRLLDHGLPPLARSAELEDAARGHGLDMLAHVYYHHLSLDGRTPEERIRAAGYRGEHLEESLGALVFSNYFPPELALDFLLDNLLYDEFTAPPERRRNLLAADLSEIGLSFHAESVALLPGRPHVYLLVADFGRPLEPRRYLVGQAPAPARLIRVFDAVTGRDEFYPLAAHGAFQAPHPGFLFSVEPLDEAGRRLDRLIIADQPEGSGRVGENMWLFFP